MTTARFVITLVAAVLGGCQALEPSMGALRADAGDDTRARDGSTGDAGDAVSAGDAADAGPPPPVSFKNDIRPLMNRSDSDPTGHGCKKCHYATEASHVCLDIAGLDLATLGALRRGGNNTGATIVVPGQPAASAIVQKLRGTFPTGVQMPFNGPAYWREQDIQLVERWIAEGARGADDE